MSHRNTHRTIAFAGAPIVALGLVLGGCGSSSAGNAGATEEAGQELSASPSPTAPPAPASKVIDVTISKDAVTPSGDRIAVKVNQPVVLEIDAVAAGELHVHSSPEKHIAFPAGKSQVTFSIDRPGIIEVEDHALNRLIVSLEVR
jgi:hypothetical protein